MTQPSPEEVSDFIEQCRSPTPATSDANQYIRVIEWLFFGKRRPKLQHNYWYEAECLDCGHTESGYDRGPPSGCTSCYGTNIKTETYNYNPKFMEEEK